IHVSLVSAPQVLCLFCISHLNSMSCSLISRLISISNYCSSTCPPLPVIVCVAFAVARRLHVVSLYCSYVALLASLKSPGSPVGRSVCPKRVCDESSG